MNKKTSRRKNGLRTVVSELPDPFIRPITLYGNEIAPDFDFFSFFLLLSLLSSSFLCAVH